MFLSLGEPSSLAQLVVVGESVGAAKAASPLDGLVAVRISDAIDAQERRALRNLEVRGGETVRGHRADALLGADHPNAEDGLVEAVHAARELLELGEREPRELPRREHDVVEDHGPAAE